MPKGPNYHWRQTPPFAVQVELTEGCNLRCQFCGLNGIRGKDNDFKFMSLDTARRLAAMLSATPGWRPRVEFAMHGEPSMNPQMLPILGEFRRRLPRAHLMMTSNGAGFLKDPPGLLGGALVHLNVLALDWYEDVQIVPKLLKALDAARPLAPVPRFYPQDGDANPHRRRDLSEHELVVIQDISKATAGTHSTLNNHAGAGAPPNTDGHGKRCAKPFRELSIRWDGGVAVCCNDWRGEFKCGSVLDLGLEGVWNGEPMRAARRYLARGMRGEMGGPCARCDATSYRPGLLPDQRGKVVLPPPQPADAAAVLAALAGPPLTAPVPRPWEEAPGRRLVALPVAGGG